MDRVVSPTRRRSAQILLFLMLVASIALLINALAFKQRLGAIRSASSDNTGWVVAQLDVDHKGLLRVLDRAVMGYSPDSTPAIDMATLNRIKQEFDVFYSRVDIFAATLGRIPITPKTEGKVAVLKAMRDRLTEQVDEITEPDSAAVRAFRQAVIDTFPLTREMTVLALQEISAETARAREEEERLFVRFFIQSVMLLGLMGLGTYLVVRLWRELEMRTSETSRIATMLSTAFNSTLSAVIVTDPSSRILYSNEMAQRLLQCDANQLLNAKLKNILLRDSPEQDGDTAPIGPNGWRKLIGKGPVSSRCRCADGRSVPVEVSLVEDQDITGQTIVIGFVRDVSRQVAAENDLRKALKTAQQAAQAKSMFLATMSHEMRTPLHGLMASLGLVEEARLSQANRALLKTARDCSARALMQVDDVLELTRLGESRETPEEYQPASIAADIVDELRPLARQSENEIVWISDAAYDRLPVEGLPIAFSRALYNLAGNAVKFTQNGRITIQLTWQGSPPDDLRLTVSVKDTGVGISPEDQARIFENFETAARSEVNSGTGSGLGLPIAKLAIERQGGTLELESQEGEGSCFHFTIPIRVARPGETILEHAPTACVPKAQDTPKRVLIVDDNDINLTLMTEMVRRMGHSTDTAKNGLEATEKAAAEIYDVILMDFSMPVMDGPSAAEAIRASKGPSAEAVIIGVTALIEASTGHGRAAVMDDILTKPTSREQLEEAIRQTRHEPGVTTISATKPASTARDAAAALDDLCEMVGRDTAIRLAQATLDDAKRAVSAMRSDVLSGSEKAEIVHKAVGSTGLMGFIDLSETLAEAENMLRAQRDLTRSDIPENAGAILDELIRTHEPLLKRMMDRISSDA